MKKTLLSVIACSVVLLGMISCNMNVDNQNDSDSKGPKILDLRNKKADGAVLRAARDAAPEFKAELIIKESGYKVAKTVDGSLNNPAEYNLYSGEEGKAEIEDFAKNIEITSHDDGFKLEFTAPDGFDFPWYGWDLVYVDGKGNKSTGVGNDKAVSNGKLSVVCPLVKAGKTSKFSVHLYGGKKGVSKLWDTYFYYNITPVNGLGCIDDFPDDYEPSNYVHLEDGHFLKIKNTIPPMAKNLKHNFLLGEQDTNDIPWGDGSNFHQIGNVDLEDATEEELVACDEERAVELSIDLTKYNEESDKYKYQLDYETTGQDKPYVFAMFWWTYTLDEYPGYEFSSPGICSNFIDNTDFKKIPKTE